MGGGDRGRKGVCLCVCVRVCVRVCVAVLETVLYPEALMRQILVVCCGSTMAHPLLHY